MHADSAGAIGEKFRAATTAASFCGECGEIDPGSALSTNPLAIF